MRARKSNICVGLTVLLYCAIASATETISLNFEDPRAVAVDSKGQMYVLDAKAGVVKVVARDPAPRLLSTFGGKASGRKALDHPTDLAIDRGGNIVVADAGNYRVAVFKPSGDPISEVAIPGFPVLLRVVPAPDGSTRLLLWDGASKQLVVKTLDPSYRPGASFSVEAFCPVRGTSAPLGDVSVDNEGNLWIVDFFGCEDQYTLRKFGPNGEPLGTWSHAAGQISLETQAKRGHMVRIVAGLFATDGKVFVVLGAGGAETGGLDVDVWTLGGSFVRRSKLVGPARSIIHTTVVGKTVYVADSDGLKAIFAIDVSGI